MAAVKSGATVYEYEKDKGQFHNCSIAAIHVAGDISPNFIVCGNIWHGGTIRELNNNSVDL